MLITAHNFVEWKNRVFYGQKNTRFLYHKNRVS